MAPVLDLDARTWGTDVEVITTEVTVWPFVTKIVDTAMVLLGLDVLVETVLLEEAADTVEMDEMDAWE